MRVKVEVTNSSERRRGEAVWVSMRVSPPKWVDEQLELPRLPFGEQFLRQKSSGSV